MNKVLKANIDLEHFWQFTSQPVGGGVTHMTNDNSLLTFAPWSEPGRGLSTVVRLIYNSREEHSDSPAKSQSPTDTQNVYEDLDRLVRVT